VQPRECQLCGHSDVITSGMSKKPLLCLLGYSQLSSPTEPMHFRPSMFFFCFSPVLCKSVFQAVLVRSLMQGERGKERIPRRLPDENGAWHGARSHDPEIDLNGNQESDAQLTEPPRCPFAGRLLTLESEYVFAVPGHIDWLAFLGKVFVESLPLLIFHTKLIDKIAALWICWMKNVSVAKW